MDVIEKQLLNLTHWVWAKRHESSEIEYIPKIEPAMGSTKEYIPDTTAEPAKPVKKPAAKRTPKAPKGSEWSVK
jgi:hypothetical protein